VLTHFNRDVANHPPVAGLDHNFLREGPPILFETMIFGGRHDEFLNRCA